ncbi:bifunctional phosphoribosyl-AMP cyclohydrolase/phosphoribosyl-ATP diphosphatase HisIE [[Eubacterium] cellulosolvens]
MVLKIDNDEIDKFIAKVNFEKGNGLIPAIIQDDSTDIVLMQAYMNEEALRLTLKTGKTHFWTRTRKKIWKKGEESGHHSLVQNAILDCDNDAILIKVQQIGPCCHTNKESCFHKPIVKLGEKVLDARMLEKVFEIINERRDGKYDGSYVASMLKKGENAIIEKIEEEKEELIFSIKKESKSRIVSETTDLIFHLLILLSSKKIELKDIFEELDERHKAKSNVKI